MRPLSWGDCGGFSGLAVPGAVGLHLADGVPLLLRLAASLADQALINLGDAITGIDQRNVGLLIKSVQHAAGRHQLP